MKIEGMKETKEKCNKRGSWNAKTTEEEEK